jgi:cytochrome d ubiquinol oxidase subunit II
MLASTAFGIYPDVLPAVNPENSLTIENAAASDYGQSVGLIWWSIGIVLAAIYFIVIYRLSAARCASTTRDTRGRPPPRRASRLG